MLGLHGRTYFIPSFRAPRFSDIIFAFCVITKVNVITKERMMATSQKWTDEEVRQIIDFFRENNELWNPKHCNYLNTKLKNHRIAVFAKDMGTSVDEIKKKWNNLRTQFRKEFMKMKNSRTTGTSPDFVYVPGWVFYSDLLFLADALDSRSTVSNLELPGEMSIEENDVPEGDLSHMEHSQNGDSQGESHELNIVESQEILVPSPQMHSPNVRSLKRKADNSLLIQSAIGTLQNISAEVSKRTKDVDSLSTFGHFIVEEMREIKNFKVIEKLKFEMHKLVYEAKQSENV